MAKQSTSALVQQVAAQLGLNLVAEFPFAQALRRRFRFDFADVERRIAIELEGGVWTYGRHTRPQGYIRDIEKYNIASALGWMLIRVPAHLAHKHLAQYIADAQRLLAQSAIQRALVAIRAANHATRDEIALLEQELAALKQRSKTREPEHASVEEANNKA